MEEQVIQHQILKQLQIISSSKNFDDVKTLLQKLSSFIAAKTFADKNYIEKELQQITETKTIERTQYYVKRLIKSLTSVKTSAINDINLNRWKDYDEIITDSLWMFDKRDSTGAHNAGYWGNYIPQIPNQFLKRYTKENDWVLDTFLGSGTTLIESKRLGRNGIGIELQPEVCAMATQNIDKEKSNFSTQQHIINADTIELNYAAALQKLNVKKVQFAFAHPPYFDIIKFSSNDKDLSNAATLEIFLTKMNTLAKNIKQVLEKKRYCALVISDKYDGGEWIPLAFYTMQQFLKEGFLLKSTIIKNFDETKGKQNQKELWRYRALVGGFYVFKHEYIFLFQNK